MSETKWDRHKMGSTSSLFGGEGASFRVDRDPVIILAANRPIGKRGVQGRAGLSRLAGSVLASLLLAGSVITGVVRAAWVGTGLSPDSTISNRRSRMGQIRNFLGKKLHDPRAVSGDQQQPAL